MPWHQKMRFDREQSWKITIHGMNHAGLSKMNELPSIHLKGEMMIDHGILRSPIFKQTQLGWNSTSIVFDFSQVWTPRARWPSGNAWFSISSWILDLPWSSMIFHDLSIYSGGFLKKTIGFSRFVPMFYPFLPHIFLCFPASKARAALPLRAQLLQQLCLRHLQHHGAVRVAPPGQRSHVTVYYHIFCHVYISIYIYLYICV